MNRLKKASIALLLVWILQAFDITLQQGVECVNEGAVRLVSGDGLVDSVNELEGRVEVCLGGQWGTVCDDDWDGRDAAVVCKQLGYPSVFSTASKFARFGRGPRLQPIHLDEVGCTGSEERLIDCFNDTRAGTDCSHSEDAGVVCEGDTCSDGAVRLVGGSDAKEGRVEVCFNNSWSSVCSEGWDSNDAAVVCRQLGLSPQSAMSVPFGPGLGPIALENVSCSGTEQTLLQCPSDITEEGFSQCLQHAGTVCEPPCTLDGLTECGLSPNDPLLGINNEELCFCTSDCVDFGDCCRDVWSLANCTDGAPVCNDSDVRLEEGTRAWNGRLEVCIHGQWGSVCERHFEEVDAQVVCRELGFPEENAFALPGGTFGQIERIWLAGVECLGIESSILECQSMGAGNFIPCQFGNASGVWCAGAAPPECTESEIRLANGTSPSNGRVEVCHRGVWGTVCSDSWDERDAAVVCRELGQESAHAVPIFELTFGSGTGPIVLDDVECIGQEPRLTECDHPGNLVHNCFRNQEASVSCREGPVARCTDSPPIVAEEELIRFGVCEPYSGNSSICNRVFTEGVDLVYIPHTRGQDDQSTLLRELETALGGLISAAPETCQDLFSRFLCNSYFFVCGSDDGFSPPVSVCSEECSTVQTECPELWAALGRSPALGGLDFANCSTVGRALEPLPHCCSDAGIAPVDCAPDQFLCRFGVIGAASNRCLPGEQLCDGNNDCVGGTDELNCPEMVTVARATPFSQSVQEGNPDDVVVACVEVVSGNVTRPLQLTGVASSLTAIDQIDFRGGSVPLILLPGETRVCFNSEELRNEFIIDDNVFEFVESFLLRVSPAGIIASRFVEVVPGLDTTIVYIVDDEVAVIGFDQPVYHVREDAGEVELTVQLLGSRVPVIDRPVVFTYYTEDRNATNGEDYLSHRGPQIGSLSREPEEFTGDQRVLSFRIIDDDLAERPETFRVRLMSSETGIFVSPDRGEATVVIVDNDGEPPPRDLEVRFTGNTPRVVGNSIVFQVMTNRDDANIRCQINRGMTVDCQVGETVTIDDLALDNYFIRVTATSGRERDDISSSVAITSPGTCTTHFVGRGLTVDGESVMVEFASDGPGQRTFTCNLDRGGAQACESPYRLSNLSEGNHHFRINVFGRSCDSSRPFTFRFDIE